MRISQIQQGKSVLTQQGAGTKIPPFGLPTVTLSLLPVGGASSIGSMVYWLWGSEAATMTQIHHHSNTFPKLLWESDCILTGTYCDIKIISFVQLYCSYKCQYSINCKKTQRYAVSLTH